MMTQDGNTFETKVFRGDDLFRTEIKDVAGNASRALYQANFVLATPLPDGSTLASLYDVPTNRYIWDQDARHVHIMSNVGGKLSDQAEQDYRILDDAEVRIGDCAFATKHYVVTTKTASLSLVYEGWLAPALNATLKYRIAVTSTSGKASEKLATAVAIRTLPPGAKAP